MEVKNGWGGFSSWCYFPFFFFPQSPRQLNSNSCSVQTPQRISLLLYMAEFISPNCSRTKLTPFMSHNHNAGSTQTREAILRVCACVTVAISLAPGTSQTQETAGFLYLLQIRMIELNPHLPVTKSPPHTTAVAFHGQPFQQPAVYHRTGYSLTLGLLTSPSRQLERGAF